jgi:hypothetical protein
MLRHRLGGTSLLLAELVITSVDRDPIYPCPHCCFALELVSLSEGGEKGLLGRIEGLFPVTEDSQTYRENPTFVNTHDLVEGLVVSVHHTRQELGVMREGGHGRNRTSEIDD